MINKNKLISVTTICFILFGTWYFYQSNKTSETFKYSDEFESETKEDLSNEKSEESENYLVYITGAVVNPDVYEVKKGKRIVDVLNMAGGALQNADLEKINLAEAVEDGQHIIIPDSDYGPHMLFSNSYTVDKNDVKVQNNTTKLININIADIAALDTLPGVGESTAQNIIDYREENGKFKSIEEIKNVSRIGDKMFEKIKDKITVD